MKTSSTTRQASATSPSWAATFLNELRAAASMTPAMLFVDAARRAWGHRRADVRAARRGPIASV